MRLFGCRKATTVRKAKQVKRESTTIRRLVSLLSRRIIAGSLLGEYAPSLSISMPIMAQRKSEVVGEAMREVVGECDKKRVMPSKGRRLPATFDTPIRKRGVCSTAAKTRLVTLIKG